MRAGGQPFRDVFSSQGPLFLPLALGRATSSGLRTANAPACSSMLAALLLVGATYAAGRAITDRAGALIAAGLVSVDRARSLWITGPIAADGAALAFATLTIALRAALAGRRHRPARRVARPRRRRHDLGEGAARARRSCPVALVLLAGRRLAADRGRGGHRGRLPPRAVAAVGTGQRVGRSRTPTTSTWPPIARPAPTLARCSARWATATSCWWSPWSS